MRRYPIVELPNRANSRSSICPLQFTSVANRQYIEQLQAVILQLHNCKAEHVNSEHVEETYQGETVWEGTVEVFTVTDHPRAKRAYAWSYNQGSSNETFTAVLEIPPVRSALDAVRVSIIAATKKQFK
jgi:hypothetical protein